MYFKIQAENGRGERVKHMQRIWRMGGGRENETCAEKLENGWRRVSETCAKEWENGRRRERMKHVQRS